MRALKKVLTISGSVPTLIFDEIDQGVGGKTAFWIGEKLKVIASGRQIICVTHLPQIASFAAHHYTITKKTEKDRTFTTIRKLDPDHRVEEIARLMSGSLQTPASLAGARDMLERNAGP